MHFDPLDQWVKNLKRPLLIAGPCSAESQEQVLATAKELKKLTSVSVFRAGIWKPRTRPNTFEGPGEKALLWLQKVKEETGLMLATEVANPHHVELALKYGIDILWIGARTTAGPFAVQEIAQALKGVDIPVMVKNPVNPDMATWVGAIERFANVGVTKLAAIHRGFAHLGGMIYRNSPMWKMAIDLKSRYPDLPLICDPSHIAGKRDLIAKVCQKALDIDCDGLMIESHPEPDKALSDAAQQLTPHDLSSILNQLSYSKEHAKNNNESELEELRAKIDRIDTDLIEALSLRMKIVEEIGEVKKKNKVTALQKSRLQELMKQRVDYAKSLNLNAQFVLDIFHTIHTESVKFQTDMMSGKDDEE